MSLLKTRLQRLISDDALRGERLILSFHSIGWAAYLISPLVRYNFLNIAGAVMLAIFGVQILIDLLYSDRIRIGEGLQGVGLWVIVIAHHITYSDINDTLFLMWVPLLISWWVLAVGLSKLRNAKV